MGMDMLYSQVEQTIHQHEKRLVVGNSVQNQMYVMPSVGSCGKILIYFGTYTSIILIKIMELYH